MQEPARAGAKPLLSSSAKESAGGVYCDPCSRHTSVNLLGWTSLTAVQEEERK